MLARIKSAFPHSEERNCLKSLTQKKFVVVDTAAGKCRILQEKEEICYPCFVVENPNSNQVNFLAIDFCVYTPIDGEKCDFAVFDQKKFCFVELKTGGGNNRTRKQTRSKAISQLGTTIEKFQKLISFDDYSVNAFVCSGHSEPTPKSPASNKNRVIEFLEKYNVDLCSGNIMVF